MFVMYTDVALIRPILYCSHTATETKPYPIYWNFWGTPQEEVRNNELGMPQESEDQEESLSHAMERIVKIRF